VIAAARRTTAVGAAAIRSASRPQPAPGENRSDRDGNPIEGDEQLVKRRSRGLEKMQQRETREGDDPDNDQMTDAAAVNNWQEFAGRGWDGTFCCVMTDRLYSTHV